MNDRCILFIDDKLGPSTALSHIILLTLCTLNKIKNSLLTQQCYLIIFYIYYTMGRVATGCTLEVRDRKGARRYAKPRFSIHVLCFDLNIFNKLTYRKLILPLSEEVMCQFLVLFFFKCIVPYRCS